MGFARGKVGILILTDDLRKRVSGGWSGRFLRRYVGI